MLAYTHEKLRGIPDAPRARHGYHRLMSDDRPLSDPDMTLSLGRDRQALARSAIAAIVQIQANRELVEWEYEAALSLLADALRLGLYKEGLCLGHGLVTQEPDNERARELVHRAQHFLDGSRRASGGPQSFRLGALASKLLDEACS